MQTLLLVQDTDDDKVHLISSNSAYYLKLSNKELEEAFKILIRAAKPVFSGALDHRVNYLEIAKVRGFM